ncbi:hypothetical protein NM208_g15537 [Fusarium decemcellulare]|uniref:Uncharacterized protein n=1 Tax=Fusarium decemcellulare TaxID=57161 RepID=A0ACC1RG47_9HYPO|nr:hypothetical protein NM208_g15537 [Fusarium decemcellulare]
MKVIVTGATGMVGKEIVRNCLADPRITKVVILTRRAVSMDIESHPKADVMMLQDFSRYSDDLLRRLEGASACLCFLLAARLRRDSTLHINPHQPLMHLATVLKLTYNQGHWSSSRPT